MTLKDNRYTYRVTWSDDDNEYVGLCTKFPSLSWLAKDPQAALRGICKLVQEVIEDMRREGEAVPEPIALKHFSGKFMARVFPQVHKKLAIEALYVDPTAGLAKADENADLVRLTLDFIKTYGERFVFSARPAPFRGLGFESG
jgi:predicted RNase H-like HicB family nuclease